MNDISAVILAGGNASRLSGIDKGNIEIAENLSIIQHLINQLHNSQVSNVIISANKAEPYQHLGLEVIPDIRRGIGPLAGIESGLAYFAQRGFQAVMFIPCDMPNFTSAEISTLANSYLQSSSQIVYAKTDYFNSHPLSAIVDAGLGDDISKAIDLGHRKILDVWDMYDSSPVMFDDESSFVNINTRTDIKCFCERR